MVDYQIWLVDMFARADAVGDFMRLHWSWPLVESLHFTGLCLLVGNIFVFDLRLLGVARRVPIRAMHRMIRWGLLGFGLSVATGSLFLMTEPDQYIYNPSFHFKV